MALRQYFLPLALAATSLSLASPAFAQKPVKITQVPAIVSTGRAPALGAYNQNATMHLIFHLALRNEDELDSLIADLSDPSSKSFRKYLTPSEFDARFGPTPASLEAVQSWAQAKGFKVLSHPANNRYLEVEAPVSSVNNALHVSVTAYRDERLKRTFFAPDREPTLDLDVPLASIEGLDDSDPIHNNLVAGPNATLTKDGVTTSVKASRPTSSIYSGGTVVDSILVNDNGPLTQVPKVTGSAPGGYYLPSDMRAAYYGNGPLTGAGQSVAIFSFDGYLTSDLTVYSANSGFNTSVIPVTNRLANGYSGACNAPNSTTGPCDDGEQILDIVQVMGMAPGLDHIYFYEGTAAGTELALMASDNLAKVITSSWGGGGFGTASDTYFKQMATQGQTFLNATGDSGAFNSGTYSAPSLDPYIIQVGGTSLVTNGAAGPWVSETSWAYSGGGFWISGVSSSGKYTIPTWQSTAGVINSSNKGSATYRNVPDIAAEADYDNPTVSNGVYMNGYGGTSFAAPRMGGYMALVNQYIALNTPNGNTPTYIGFFNPALYTGGLSASYPHYLHDITVGSNPATAGTVAVSYNAVAGFDDVTGWGSPNGEGLLYYLAALPDFSIAATTPAMTIVRGNQASESISVLGYSGFTANVALTVSGLPTGVTYTATTGTTTTPGTLAFTADPTTTVQGTYTVGVTGVSGSISRTASFVMNVLKRANGDFTLSATSPTIVDGAAGVSTLTIAEGAISGPIALKVSGLPSGVTAVFDSAAYDNPGTTAGSVNGTDNLTLTVPQSIVAGSYPITITGTTLGNIVHSTMFTLTVAAPPSYVLNGGFETVSGTTATGWTMSTGVLTSSTSGSHTGSYYAWMNGYGSASTDTVSQAGIAIPSGKTTATLAFFLYIPSAETTTTAKNDTLTITLTPAGGTATTIATFSNLDAGTGYVYHAIDVSAYIGKTVTLTFTGVENASLATSFKLDDVSLFTNN